MSNNDISKTSQKSTEKFRVDYIQPEYLIDEIHLCIKLSPEQTSVYSQLNVRKHPEWQESHDGSSVLTLNGANLKLLDLKLDGVSLPRSSFSLNDNELIITELPDKFLLEILTELNPEKNTSLQGLYKSGDIYCTQCEAEGFRNITYYLDRPDVMSVFTTRIEADKNKFPFLLSNGNLIESGELDKGQHFKTWYDPFPKPCYLFALVAGDFDLLQDTYKTASGREVDLEIYVDKGKLNQCHHAMASLKKAMKWDEDVYGLEYDLNIYMIVAVSDFNMGAMENKGLNIFNTCYILANSNTATDSDLEGVEGVVAHEYFHNWTGNRVTCRDWFQLSLKEGLTVFRDQEFSSDMNSRSVKRLEDARLIRTLQFAEDAGPMAHPIRPDSYIEMNNFYTHTVYIKGAEVIRMIHTLLGEEGFQLGMKLYFKRHDGQAVTCEDFVKAMEDANDVDLSLFRNWYSQAGTPEVVVESNWNGESGDYSLLFQQDCHATPGQANKELFLIPMRLALFDEKGEMIQLNLDEKALQSQGLIPLFAAENEIVIALTKKQHSLTFHGLSREPTPSFLRGFSAPVKLQYHYTDNQLSLLLSNDNDSYTNWDAGQLLMTRVIMKLTGQLVENQPIQDPDILASSLALLLDKSEFDPNLLAMSLKVPELNFLLEQFDEIPFDELVRAHKAVNHFLAKKLYNKLLKMYHKAILKANQGGDSEKGWRSLQNACLSLLALSEKKEIFQLAVIQFNQSTNMTNSLAALKVLTHSESTSKNEILERFYEQWQDEELVIDKWFAVQATNPYDCAIDVVNQLLQHADFEISNPNKIRALLMSFAKGNLINFHREDGEGYILIADVIIKLNKINPQIAARMAASFNQWRKFDKQRRKLMKIQLKGLIKLDNLSPDVYEIISKALI
ncbi:MAG: aminopeptidase N [Gammaproteobacteria bacterium]|nr:aminopeptidase N [Gammaproteobacteria bacterium]